MAMVIEYDSPVEEERIEVIKAGGIFAEMGELKGEPAISVSWSKQINPEFTLSNRLKGIGGRGVVGGGGYLPLSLTNCRSLRRTFGDKLEISEELNEWAYTEIDRIESIENFSSASSDAELSARFAEEAPRIARAMHAYQRAGTAFCAKTKRALLADQPGLGKTLQTLATMIEADVEGDILVAAPSAAVAITWPDELATWLPDEEVIAVMGTGHQRHKTLAEVYSQPRQGKRRWIVVNLEMCRAKWIKPIQEFRYPKTGINKKDGEKPEKRWFPVDGWWDYSYPEFFGDNVWSAIIVDESHRCLISKTGILQSQNQTRSGMAQLELKEGGIKLALSGTPMRGKPENLWGTLNWLYPERYTSYWNWAAQWFIIFGDDKDKEVGELNEALAQEFYQDIKPIMLRRTKKEVRAELPDKLYAGTPLPDEDGEVTEHSPVGHWIEMSPKQSKAYHDIQSEAETLLDSGILVANGVLAELTRLKQFATTYGDLEQSYNKDGDEQFKFIPKMPSNKFDWIVEFLDDLGINKNSTMELEEDGEEEVRKVVIASQFTSILDLYEKELNRQGIKTLKITGKVSQKDRKIAKDTWQADGGPRVFLLNTQAGGVSLTLDSADDLVFLDETWIPDDQEQVEDRIHRASRMHQVTIHYLRSKETIEENIALIAGSRERVTKRLIDGERGVSFAKKLLTPIKRAPKRAS